MNLHIAYSPDYLNWLLGAGDGSHPTNPVRAKLATDLLTERLGNQVSVVQPLGESQRAAAIEAVKSIHEADYVDRVLAGYSSEWSGVRPEMGETALAMFAGTMRAVELLLAGEATVVFNPQGAKHHARFNYGSGFCVFNDMAWAAVELQKAGLKPLYLDWDIHAGDGVYHLLKGTGIPAISIHNGGIYPIDAEMQNLNGKRETLHRPDQHSYNFNVVTGDGDDAFGWAVDGAADIIRQYQPDVILLAAGADGHGGQGNLGEINSFTAAGFAHAAKTVAQLANEFSAGRVIIGGAGGYQPLKETPETWALVVETIYNETKKETR